MQASQSQVQPGSPTTIEAEERADTFVPHRFEEQLVDLGEIRMNYAVAGADELPALLLIPAQTESWWGYEGAIEILSQHFRTYAVDLRGQGRSSWTPGRYSVDIWGNDLVRFIDTVVGRPTVVSGNSSGGLLAAWLAAYAKPGQIRGAVVEDGPLFSSELLPSVGPSIRQAVGPLFKLFSKWLGDQWTVGNWGGMLAAMGQELPPAVLRAVAVVMAPPEGAPPPDLTQPPQNLREYDPEWARAFYSGEANVNVPHDRMLAAVKAPILYTHHRHEVDPATGTLIGAVTDQQVQRARELVTGAGQSFEIEDLPEMVHGMHQHDPELFSRLVLEFAGKLPAIE